MSKEIRICEVCIGGKKCKKFQIERNTDIDLFGACTLRHNMWKDGSKSLGGAKYNVLFDPAR